VLVPDDNMTMCYVTMRLSEKCDERRVWILRFELGRHENFCEHVNDRVRHVIDRCDLRERRNRRYVRFTGNKTVKQVGNLRANTSEGPGKTTSA